MNENNNEKQPLDKKFETVAQQMTVALLSEFPEIASVSIVVDWNLPGWAGDSMPSAVWRPASNVVAPYAMANMQQQLARAMGMLMRAHLSHVMQVAAEGNTSHENKRSNATEST